MDRLSYAESCRELERSNWIEKGSAPAEPRPRRPQFDDETLGIQFFRTLAEDASLSNLTIPRTFFGRSEIRRTSFVNTDMSESTLCWNDFIDVDFTKACLADSDLRAALFERVNFSAADLRRADLRRSSFTACSFKGATMDGAKLTRDQLATGELAPEQRRVVDWQDDEGDEPGGG